MRHSNRCARNVGPSHQPRVLPPPAILSKTTLKAEIDEDAWAALHSDTSRPFDKPTSGRIAVKVINHLGDEVMKVFRMK